MAEVEVTAILPVYNDRRALETAIPRAMEELSRIAKSYELIVAEDGSTDGSAQYVESLTASMPGLRLLHSDERLGRRKALNRAIREAQGSIVCYFDVDLATDMQHLSELIGSIREGYDISTGSRLLGESDVVRSGDREFASRGYNMLVRTILRSRIYDHQCGFKAFRKSSILPLLPRLTSEHWFWDTELLVRAQREGLRVREFPVRWRAGRGTTVRTKDVVEMGSAIMGLWWQLHVAER
ncbi:MAG TPA: dolichyl-phosphate beta-glucosyltransferase [Methanomicrobiales archaeon]|nr:dolichyl-phosphate beta-glucosyltransferase [Methanomicrobiales archaeon]